MIEDLFEGLVSRSSWGAIFALTNHEPLTILLYVVLVLVLVVILLKILDRL